MLNDSDLQAAVRAPNPWLAWRRLLGLTQAQLAELLDLSPSTIGRWERCNWERDRIVALSYRPALYALAYQLLYDMTPEEAALRADARLSEEREAGLADPDA